MANMAIVNRAIKARFPGLRVLAVRGNGYVYFVGEDGFDRVESVYSHPQPVVDTAAVIDVLKTAQNHCALNFSVSAERCIQKAINLLSAGKEKTE